MPVNLLSLVFICVLSALTGCTMIYRVEPQPATTEWPNVAKAPYHVGIYYSPQFEKYEHTRTVGSNVFVIPIGAESVRLFDNLIPRLFEQTSLVHALPVDKPPATPMDAVIAPSIEHFDFRTGFDSDSDRYSVSYRITIYTPRGEPVESWVVAGNAQTRSMGTLEGWVEDDMNDAAVDLLREFARKADHVLATIAANAADPVERIDLGRITLTADYATLPGLDAQTENSLRDQGLVMLKVVAKSSEDRRLVVRASNMRLQLASGVELEPIAPSAALSLLDRTSQTGGVVAAAVGAPFGLLHTYGEVRSQQTTRDLQGRQIGISLFGDRQLEGEAESGIVLFRLPQASQMRSDARLSVWIEDPSMAPAEKIVISLPEVR